MAYAIIQQWVASEGIENFEMKYGGRDLRRLHFVTVLMFNNGNVDLQGFPVVISLPLGEILDVEVKAPKGEKYGHLLGANEVRVDVALFGVGETFTATVLLADPQQGAVEVAARQEGLDVEEVPPGLIEALVLFQTHSPFKILRALLWASRRLRG